MPVVVAWIGEMLLTVVGQMAIRALVGLGVGFAVHAAASGAISTSTMQSYFAGAGPLLNWMGFFGIDTSMTIILSAWAGRVITDSVRASLAQLPATSGSSGSSGGAE
jgi:uncharacterized membrane protein